MLPVKRVRDDGAPDEAPSIALDSSKMSVMMYRVMQFLMLVSFAPAHPALDLLDPRRRCQSQMGIRPSWKLSNLD
jgi:hypothetical protein